MHKFRRQQQKRTAAIVLAIGVPAVAVAIVLALCCGVLFDTTNSQANAAPGAEMVLK